MCSTCCELSSLAPAAGFRIAAVTRRIDLVPAGIEPVELATPSQELRMTLMLPRLLRGLGAALGHFQYALPLVLPCPAVVTIHDLSFEREPSLMSRKDRLVFRKVVPRAARKAVRVRPSPSAPAPTCASSTTSRTRRSWSPRTGSAPPSRQAVSHLAAMRLLVGAVQERKNPLAALAAAEAAGLPLVVAGPAKDEALARELERRGARVTGYVEQDELVRLYRGAACLVQPSRYEGFGLPVLEAMACGTPVVAVPEPALQEVAGDAAVWAEAGELADGIRRAIADRDRLVAAGLGARLFSWRETAKRTLEVYREALGR